MLCQFIRAGRFLDRLGDGRVLLPRALEDVFDLSRSDPFICHVGVLAEVNELLQKQIVNLSCQGVYYRLVHIGNE